MPLSPQPISSKTEKSDCELKYPIWQIYLQEAILEFDREQLLEKIRRIEAAIFERLQALPSDTDHIDERQALADATPILRRLKKERLSYPAEK